MFDLGFRPGDTDRVTDLANPFQAPEPPAVRVSDPPEPPADPPAPETSPEAPYGYMKDRATGEVRPRKRAGRRGLGASDGQDTAPAGTPRAEREPDRVPGKVKPETKGRRARAPKAESEPLPPFRAGPIAKGVNKLYLRAGKILKAMDRDLGVAVITMTKPEYDSEGERVEGDITVGEAWEAVAQVNPRIRRMLLKLIEGGAWSALFWAHVPLLLAIMMKESVARRIPFARLLAVFMNDADEDGDDPAPGGPGGLLAGLTQADVAQAMAAFNQFMPGAAAVLTEDQMAGYATVREPGGAIRPAVADDFGMDAWPGDDASAQ